MNTTARLSRAGTAGVTARTSPDTLRALETAAARAIDQGLSVEEAWPLLQDVLTGAGSAPDAPTDAPTDALDSPRRKIRVADRMIRLLEEEFGDLLNHGAADDIVGDVLVITAHAVIRDPELRALLLSSGFVR